MDRLDALRAFVIAVEEGSLASAGRRLGLSPAAMTRALAALESKTGMRLFERGTRRLRLSEAGHRYAEAACRVLAEADALDGLPLASAAPQGRITLTAPRTAGAEILLPVLHAFLDSFPGVGARVLLLDRVISLIEEGFDAALRIAHLPDSALVATRVGAVRRALRFPDLSDGEAALTRAAGPCPSRFDQPR